MEKIEQTRVGNIGKHLDRVDVGRRERFVQDLAALSLEGEESPDLARGLFLAIVRIVGGVVLFATRQLVWLVLFIIFSIRALDVAAPTAASLSLNLPVGVAEVSGRHDVDV